MGASPPGNLTASLAQIPSMGSQSCATPAAAAPARPASPALSHGGLSLLGPRHLFILRSALAEASDFADEAKTRGGLRGEKKKRRFSRGSWSSEVLTSPGLQKSAQSSMKVSQVEEEDGGEGGNERAKTPIREDRVQ